MRTWRERGGIESGVLKGRKEKKKTSVCTGPVQAPCPHHVVTAARGDHFAVGRPRNALHPVLVALERQLWCERPDIPQADSLVSTASSQVAVRNWKRRTDGREGELRRLKAGRGKGEQIAVEHLPPIGAEVRVDDIIRMAFLKEKGRMRGEVWLRFKRAQATAHFYLEW